MTPIHGPGGTATSSRASSTVVVGQRERTNGWSCPWHPLQFTAWFLLLFFAVAYFGVSVNCLPREWRAAGYIIPGGVYVIHVIYHILALTINPADINVRGGPAKAMFDRSQHQHVIENSHCYICQSEVGPTSKHCSVCNKCISGFDHHCKWLNNCVGDRNYKLFIGCISSAFIVALLVFAVQLYISISFFHDKEGLREKMGGFKLFVAVTDTVFIVFAGVVAILLLVALALLGHLLGFHIYLMHHKMSTYDFIVNARDGRKQGSDVEAKRTQSTRRLRKNKVKPQETTGSVGSDRVELNEVGRSPASSQVLHSETSVKIINEVSSKAAARHHRGTESASEWVQPDANGLETQHPSLHPPKDTESISSEESLKEIGPKEASAVDSSSSPNNASPSGSQPDRGDSDRSSDEETLVPCKTLTNSTLRIVPDIDDVGAFYSPRCPDNDATRSRDTNTDSATPRKKKKKNKPKGVAKKAGELPPLSIRPGRPLPVLRLQPDTGESNS